MQAIQNQSREESEGQLGAEPNAGGQTFLLAVTSRGALSTLREFDDIIIKADTNEGGHFVRIRDVGHIELDSSSYGQFFNLGGKFAAGVAIYQLAEANVQQAGNAVKATSTRLAKDMPKDFSYPLPFNATTFVLQAVTDVYESRFEAALPVLAAAAVPADHDDLVRVHTRRGAARDRDRRQRKRAPFAQDCGIFGGARFHLHRRAVDRVVLCAVAASFQTARGATPMDA